MRNWKALVATALGLALLGGFAIRSMDHALDRLCGNTLVDEVISPDGARKAVVFQRNCGATTDNTTQVSILPANAPLPDVIGNLMAADTGYGRAPAGPASGPQLLVVWRGPSHLTVFHHPNARLFGAPSALDSISILYQEIPPDMDFQVETQQEATAPLWGAEKIRSPQ